jgi:hypothetical protein
MLIKTHSKNQVMKNGIIPALIGCLVVAISCTTPVHAQESKASTHPKNTLATAAAIISEPGNAHTGVNVRTKVMRTFLQNFEGATGVRWSRDGKRYLASFTQGDQTGNALVAANGAMLYSLRYGTEKHLPREVRHLVRSTYYDVKIQNVTEVNSNNIRAWIVSMQDADNLVVVRVLDGALDELSRYKTHF